MINKKILQYVCFFLSFYGGMTFGQGSGDPGIASAGWMNPLSSGTYPAGNSFGVFTGYARGENQTQIISPQLDFTSRVSPRSMVNIRIPFMFLKGKITSNQGLGDPLMTFNHILDSSNGYKLLLIAGLRIAAGSASRKYEKISLPMVYQLGLGTTDMLLGLKLQLKNHLSLAAGYQQPLVNRNQNEFDSLALNGFQEKKILDPGNNYVISSKIKRKGDLVFRADKSIIYRNTDIGAGIQGIYHLGQDRVEEKKGQTVSVNNSSGITCNANFFLIAHTRKTTEWNLAASIPLIQKKSYPDGLMRAFLVSAGFRFSLI